MEVRPVLNSVLAFGVETVPFESKVGVPKVADNDFQWAGPEPKSSP